MYKPSWYKDNQILIVNASTCGINKDGHEQYVVNPETGIRSINEINDELALICDQIREGNYSSPSINYHPEHEVLKEDIFIPKYFDDTYNNEIRDTQSKYSQIQLKTIGELIDLDVIEVTNGHGSPSSDQRIGEIPYIKVSDLRAGTVNINPTNMIPITLAKQFWRGECSTLKPYDLISPERASKNIGEFCILMPGQQDIVLTKEVIIIRATKNAHFNQFYLMWALSLSSVRKQWDRIVFMQTNREDVGKRINEILLPYPTTQEFAGIVSKPFKDYYEGLEKLRKDFIKHINDSAFNHHIYLGEI